MTGPISTPCRQVCRLGPDLHCDGCGRTPDEIARWIRMSEPERRAVMARLAGWTIREAERRDPP